MHRVVCRNFLFYFILKRKSSTKKKTECAIFAKYLLFECYCVLLLNSPIFAFLFTSRAMWSCQTLVFAQDWRKHIEQNSIGIWAIIFQAISVSLFISNKLVITQIISALKYSLVFINSESSWWSVCLTELVSFVGGSHIHLILSMYILLFSRKVAYIK